MSVIRALASRFTTLARSAGSGAAHEDSEARPPGRPWRTSHVMLAAGAIYLLARLVSALIMLHVASMQDPNGVPGGPDGARVSYGDMTRMWDGEWYRRIAQDGYPSDVPRDDTGTVLQNPLAFYPLMPMLARADMSLTGAGFAPVASTMALLAGLAAALLMVVLLTPRVGQHAALAAMTLYAVSPPSPVLQMAYTESFAMLLLVGVLLAFERRAWWAVAALALVIGFTRPIGLPLVVVAVVACLIRIRARAHEPIGRREGWGMGTAVIACGLSGMLWPLTAWALTGERGAYTATMAAWRPSKRIVPFEAWWDNFDVLFVWPFGPIVLGCTVVVMLVWLVGPWSRVLGPVLLTWCAAYTVYLFATLAPWSSTIRYLLLLFPLLATLTGARTMRERPRALVAAAVLAVIVAVWAQEEWAMHFLRLVPPVGNPP